MAPWHLSSHSFSEYYHYMQALIQLCSSDRKEKFKSPLSPHLLHVVTRTNRTLKPVNVSQVDAIPVFQMSWLSMSHFDLCQESHFQVRFHVQPWVLSTQTQRLVVTGACEAIHQEPNHKGLGQPIPGLQGLGRNRTLDRLLSPCFQMSKVTYGGRFIQRKFPMNCYIVSHFWLIFTFPSCA